MQYVMCAMVLLATSVVTPGSRDADFSQVRYRRHARPEPVDQSTAPFPNQPLFKCDVDKTPSPVHIEFIASADSTVLGGVEQDDGKGGITQVPLQAKYARRGPDVVVYTETWDIQARDPRSMSLGRSVPRANVLMRLTWTGKKGPDGRDNHWVGTWVGSAALKCTDWTKGGLKD